MLLVSDSRVLVFVSRSLVSDSQILESDSWTFLVSDSQILVSDSHFLPLILTRSFKDPKNCRSSQTELVFSRKTGFLQRTHI